MTVEAVRLAAQLEQLARLLRANPKIRQIAWDHVDDIPGRNFRPDGGSRTTQPHGALNPLEAAALRRDPHLETAQALDRWLQATDQATDRAIRTAHRVLSHGDPTATATTRAIGGCEACGRHVPGTEQDRLRGGYCDACRKAYARAGRPDRAAFNRRRTSPAGDAAR